MPPEMFELESSSIASVGFDDRGDLFVRLRDGHGLYRYADVPRVTFVALCTAASPGRYYNEHVRNRFECTKMD